MQNFFPVLRQCQLFSGIAENDLLAMLRCLNVTVQQYRKGQTLIAEGEKPEKFGIVLSGAVQLWRIDYSGNRSIMASVAPSRSLGNPLSVQRQTPFPSRWWHLNHVRSC